MSNTTEAAVRSAVELAVAAWLSVGVDVHISREELITTLMKLINDHADVAIAGAVKIALDEATANATETIKTAKQTAGLEQLERDCKAICVDCAEELSLINYRGHAVHNNGRTCEAVAIRSQILEKK